MPLGSDSDSCRLGPTEDPIHFGLATDQRPQPALPLGSVLGEPASEVVQRKWLQQVVDRAELEGALDGLGLVRRTDHDHVPFHSCHPHLVEQIKPEHVW